MRKLQLHTDKIFGTSKEIEQNLIEPENFDICFCIIFDCSTNVFMSEKGYWALNLPNFEIFFNNS